MPKAEDEVALEAVTELDGKFEEWHLQAKQDAAQAKADSEVGQAKVAHEIAALAALVAKLARPTDPVYVQARENQEGDPPVRVAFPEPEPKPDRGTPERLTRSDPLEQAEDELLKLWLYL